MMMMMVLQAAGVWASDSAQAPVYVVHTQRSLLDPLLHAGSSQCRSHAAQSSITTDLFTFTARRISLHTSAVCRGSSLSVCLSVCLYIRLCVTLMICVITAEQIKLMVFGTETIPLVSEHRKISELPRNLNQPSRLWLAFFSAFSSVLQPSQVVDDADRLQQLNPHYTQIWSIARFLCDR